ncbi:S8 family serine peptidase, partial [Planococcus sp. SIMBA_143]
YDLVDLDEDPMETQANQGIPTMHGTHVAGIIAADGELKGVAPDAEIYAYRALGPGGSGTSVQVIAAMEQAVKDGVDVMNLSLGNNVNGPDYP